MLSKRLTFSLASLIVLLMIGLCVPVEAQRVTKAITVPIPIAAFAPTAAPTEAIFEANTFAVLGPNGGTASPGFLMDEPYEAVAAAAAPNSNLPDLEEFFRFGGTLELQAQVKGTGNAEPIKSLKYKDIVISEIMWGANLDAGAPVPSGETAVNIAARPYNQWIELYNTKSENIGTPAGTGGTPAAVFIGAGHLRFKFTPFVHLERATDGDWLVLDRMSNMQFGRWPLPGQSGATATPTEANNFRAQIPYISMYRNINYIRVEGDHRLVHDPTLVEHGINTAENRKEQLKGVPDGSTPGSWKATKANGRRNIDTADVLGIWVYASPIHKHEIDLTHEGAPRTTLPADAAADKQVIITEARNDNSSQNADWVELYNAGTEEANLWDWELSSVTTSDATKDTDKMLVGREAHEGSDDDRFPHGDNFKLQPGEYLLIVNRDPKETDLAAGIDVEDEINNSVLERGAQHRYIVRPKLKLEASSLLILRKSNDKNWSHQNPRTNRNNANKDIQDYAGNFAGADKGNYYNTEVWPFRGWRKDPELKDHKGIPHDATKAWARAYKETAPRSGIFIPDVGNRKGSEVEGVKSSGLGYDPGVDRRNAPGTPGYANNALQTTMDDLTSGEISISEVMFNAGPSWNMKQWIELYNSSMSEPVNLKGWTLSIYNATDNVESFTDSSFTFGDGAYILPNQTLLLVSGTAPRSDILSRNRIYDLYEHHARGLGLKNSRSVLLSPSGFYLELKDKDRRMVDEAGNVVVEGRSRTVPEPNWDVFTAEVGELPRRSIVRVYGGIHGQKGGTSGYEAPMPGEMEDSWTQIEVGANITYFGHHSDISTAGGRDGGPLPVSLSSFRPLRNQATGHVDIQWVTQSELNNAGFNILRSETKTGEFKVINVKGIIAGQGTTSEKHVYTFTDTTAKPNIVYYYQIEDISLDGQRTTLRTTHLRGNVSAAGKLTTTWSNLKRIQ